MSDHGYYLIQQILMACDCLCSVALRGGPWVSLQCVSVGFSDHTHLLFARKEGANTFR